jgi:hypothetical protein
MALLPTIPTSFVPHTSLAERRGVNVDLGGVFGYIAYAILGVVFLLAIGVFFYGRILSASLVSKDSALKTAEASIDSATIKEFVQLRDRLNSSQTLLNSHIVLSAFFSALGSLLPSTVRFATLHLSVDTTGATKVDGTGVSKSFNALSVASGAFAVDGRIKDVIFSKMVINKDSTISFGFSATLDPKLTYFGASEAGSSSAQPI